MNKDNIILRLPLENIFFEISNFSIQKVQKTPKTKNDYNSNWVHLPKSIQVTTQNDTQTS